MTQQSSSRAHGLPRVKSRGFTLLELIIVIAILSVLSVAVVLVINPAETLRRGRDSTRLSDLAAMKSAIGLYLTEANPPILDGLTATTDCKDEANGELFISYPSDAPGAAITDAVFATAGFEGNDGVAGGADQWNQVLAVSLGNINASGWVPVNLGGITAGAPLSNFPIDPTNTATPAGIVETDRIYIYACDEASDTFEINATLESTQNAANASGDGGDDPALYEIGTSLTIITSWQ